MGKESGKKKLLKKIFNGTNLIIVIVLVFFVFQYLQVQGVVGEFSNLQSNVSSQITEIGSIRESFANLASDSNEVRAKLGFDMSDYTIEDIIEGEDPATNSDTGKNTNQVQLAMFEYMNFLSVTEEVEKDYLDKKSYLEALSTSETFDEFLEGQFLTITSVVEDADSASVKILDPNDNEIVVFYLANEDSTLLRRTPISREEIEITDAETFESETTTYITENVDTILSALTEIYSKLDEINTAIASEEVTAVENDLLLFIDPAADYENLEYTYKIYNKNDEVIGEIVLDSTTQEITLVDLNNEESTLMVTDISTSLIPFLEDLDSKTFIEKKVVEAKEDLEATLADDGFILTLQESGLLIGEDVYEDEDRYYYPIYDADGNHLSSIVIEKATAVINIVETDGTNSENLLFFDPEFKKKTLELPDEIPEYGEELSHDDGTFNILIAGKHGNLVDTMIFCHLDEANKTVSMISVPRDLHYNGRKINSFPYFYGMDELKVVLSDMTGYELDKYILIDMYAFIDVIDLVGGIDVHLEHAVIDPTYRTVDDGVVGTLHYEPGDYHLGGKEALRLARSRHTSSDFARAARQQLIIESLQDKARNFGFGDIDTLYEISKTVLAKTETDINIDEAISYYFKYQDYEIVSNHVMSSGNVLYVPPYITVEQCAAKIAEAEATGAPRPGCESENHAYTLLPRNNNWNVVKWFFEENFEGSTEA